MSIRKSSIGLLLTASAYAYTPCPLLGPSFEPSRNLGDAPAVQEAFETLQAALENSTKTGQTDYGTWAPANNSFSIGVFDATTPGQLFYTQHSSETLQNAEQGVHEVTADTIFRLGSVSKLITTYLFMVEAGPKYWNRPVTDFVPQLKQAAEECCASDDPVGCTNWDMITLGSLASHMAGVPRDCKHSLKQLHADKHFGTSTHVQARLHSLRDPQPFERWPEIGSPIRPPTASQLCHTTMRTCRRRLLGGR